ncbi:hypothetical protein VTJ83DRAFT_535 [Remersonia thermophila]|uniref:Uncharacterized protein n=1 Tax=Remersonia thermophila TaxID=72144 RepID=A0ABR4DLA2_9PEZI
MTTTRLSVLRHLQTGSGALRNGPLASPPTPLHQQRRWARVQDVRFFVATACDRKQELKPGVLEKYRDKLARKAHEEGHADIDSLRAAYADKIDDLRKEFDAVVPPPAGGTAGPAPSAPSQQHSSLTHPPPPPPPQPIPQATPKAPDAPASSAGVKPLSSILDIPKASALPVKELTAIWRLRHASNPRSLCAVIPAETFATMEAVARQHPQFVLPVPVTARPPPSSSSSSSSPEEGGAEIHFLQWTWDAPTRSATVLFTQLAEYKARGEFAAPHTTVTHYRDLAESHGVVLMQGHVMDDRGVAVEDARWLVMCLQRFYGGWDGAGGDAGKQRAESRRRLLEWFAKGDRRFTVEGLLEEAERMG